MTTRFLSHQYANFKYIHTGKNDTIYNNIIKFRNILQILYQYQKKIIQIDKNSVNINLVQKYIPN